MYTLDNRPFSFDEMIGQEGILSEMRKRSKTNDFPEVMIFSGESGTGKTTLAQIIAALISDPNPLVNADGSHSPNPESPSSASIMTGKFNRDVSVYDASSMGKDDLLKLKQSLSLAPMFESKRVVIIDEAQELSKAGKGAVLDLLEKKRKSCYLILCTMALETFDKAARSRGQVYTFRSPSPDQIVQYLFEFTDRYLPDLQAPDEFFTHGLNIIADNCEGSVRNALQVFERCIIGEFFTVEQITHEFAFMSDEQLNSLLAMLVKKDNQLFIFMQKFGMKEFFYKSYRALSSAYLYSASGYVSDDWKLPMAKKLGGMDSLDVLMDGYIAVDSQPYFKEDLFIYHLAKFFKHGTATVAKMPDGVSSRPVRRVQVTK